MATSVSSSNLPSLSASYAASAVEQYELVYPCLIDVAATVVRVQSQQVINPNSAAFQLLDTFSIIVNDPADISEQQSERVNAIVAQVNAYLTTLYTSAYYRNMLLQDTPGRGLMQDLTTVPINPPNPPAATMLHICGMQLGTIANGQSEGVANTSFVLTVQQLQTAYPAVYNDIAQNPANFSKYLSQNDPAYWYLQNFVANGGSFANPNNLTKSML